MIHPKMFILFYVEYFFFLRLFKHMPSNIQNNYLSQILLF